MTEPVAPREPGRKRDAGRTAKATLGVIILVLVVAFAVDNRENVHVGWVFGDVRAPLAVVIMGSLVVGALIGWLLARLAQRRN
jgi:uncharacterized integral membrane protein